MITNTIARTEIVARIEAAPNGKRRGHGAAFRTTSDRAPWLARGERAVGVVGGRANLAIYSPAGAREAGSVDRILFYDHTATLAHEEVATTDAYGWFTAAFDRAA